MDEDKHVKIAPPCVSKAVLHATSTHPKATQAQVSGRFALWALAVDEGKHVSLHPKDTNPVAQLFGQVIEGSG